MKILQRLIIAITLTALVPLAGCRRDAIEIMAVTGATPLALREYVPSNMMLKVNGHVKKEYVFSSDALNAFAVTRIRTREVSPTGGFEGAYAYTGIPVYNILEGVVPKKPEKIAFDRPIDMVVTFHSKSGAVSRFSYGELTMTDDQHPITLAFIRKQVLPFKEPEKYTKNKYKDNITGLRLICPREPDTARYLDDVIFISLDLIQAPDDKLPVAKKEKVECSSREIMCLDGIGSKPAIFDGVMTQDVSGWVRMGHGRGYKSISSASGYNLRSFLKKNFPRLKPDDYFLFVGCDGYRVILTGREIFLTSAGTSNMICKTLDGKEPAGNLMLATTGDFFIDRNVWGLSHIVRLNNTNVK